MRCINCGAELLPGDAFCGECGASRPSLPPRFAEVERRFAALRARYEAGELDSATYEAELRKLIIEDDAGYWMLGTESGVWYWYDGQEWVQRDPPLAAAPAAQPQARPAPAVAVPAPPPVAPPARKRFPWRWVMIGLVGLLIVAAVVVGIWMGPQLLALVAPQPQPTATPLPTSTPYPTATPYVPTVPPPGESTPRPTATRTPKPSLRLYFPTTYR